MPKWEVAYRQTTSRGTEEVEAETITDHPPFVDFEEGSVVVLRVRADDVQTVRLKP